MLKNILIISMVICLPLMAFSSEYQWKSLDGPYWANGIDVAVGDNTIQPGNRYLIGSDNTNTNIYSWVELDSKWDNEYPANGAKKVISYKDNDNGRFAFAAVYEGQILQTIDGGVNWSAVGAAVNSKYTSIEIINQESVSPTAATVFVGCEPSGNDATAYYSLDAGGTWSRLGGDQGVDPIYGLHIYDIETIGQANITAGTDNGLYKHAVGNYGADWQPVAFSGYEVIALETVDLQDDEQMASVKLGEDNYKLYYTDDGWSSQQEVLINGQSINKEVNDMAGIYWNDPLYEPKSFYLATSEGLFLLTFEYFNGQIQNEVLYDLGDNEEFEYPPINYDRNFKSVDYYTYTEGSQIHAKVLASTPFNVYDVHEVRNTGTILDTYSVDFTEVVSGTYKCNIASVRLPRNSQSDKQIIAVSNKGLIKKGTATEWFLTGLSFLSDGTDFTHVDVATDFEGTADHDFILASFKNGTSGEVIRSSDGGATWTDVTPEGNNGMVAVDFCADYNYAFSADEHVLWVSSDGGITWDDNDTEYPNTTFMDIMSIDVILTAYACGMGDEKIYEYSYYGQDWFERPQDGLETVNEISEISNVWSSGGTYLYLATDEGIYKWDDSNDIWTLRNFGMDPNTMPMVGIAADIQDMSIWDTWGFGNLGFIALANPINNPPEVWATGDRARSWIPIDLNEIDSDCTLKCISFSEKDAGGFVIGSDNGAYYLGDIFKAKDIRDPGGTTITWGPGKVIVNSDFRIWNSSGNQCQFNIVPPCTVVVMYDFDDHHLGYDPWYSDDTPGKTAIYLWDNINSIVGDPLSGEQVIFTSSHPTQPSPGDWAGIEYSSGRSDNLYSNVKIEYADEGIFGFKPEEYFTTSFNSFEISNCDFRYNLTAGISLTRVQFHSVATIDKSAFNNCGDYGIRIEEPSPDASVHITKNTIEKCASGISYAGCVQNDNTVTIKGNTIKAPAVGAQNAIKVDKRGSGDPPVATITGNYVSDFLKGIHLSSLDENTVLRKNVVSDCDWGLFLQDSSPSILPYGLLNTPNQFNNNQIGIYCDTYSNPFVRWTRIKDNNTGGVLIEAHSGADVPDFGDIGRINYGYNSISKPGPMSTYYDMKHSNGSSDILARGNWWGEPTPRQGEILGNIDYNDYLGYDPLEPHPKRESWYSHLPDAYGLDQNYPNPFNPATSISYYVADGGFAELNIYNLSGQFVKELVSGIVEAGEHTIVWDGTNGAGTDVSSGVYFYVLETDQGKTSKSMTLLR